MNEKFIIRIYDGMDHCWTDVTGQLTKEEAEKKFAELTDNGTKMTDFSDIDYYAIFPAETKMVFDAKDKQKDEEDFIPHLAVPNKLPAPTPNDYSNVSKEDLIAAYNIQQDVSNASILIAEKALDQVDAGVIQINAYRMFLQVLANHPLTNPQTRQIIQFFLEGMM